MEKDTALYRAAWHSSSINRTNTAHLVTDGHTGYLTDGVQDAWISGGSGTEWVYIDLGVETKISRVAVGWGAEYAVSYNIQMSPDTETWQTSAVCEGGADMVTETHLNGVAARYVRILCEKCSGCHYIINTVQVYGENSLAYKTTPLPKFDNINAVQRLDGGNWRVCRAASVKADGAALSSAEFDDSKWLAATVPGTVFSSYLNSGAVPDPFYSDGQYQISEGFFNTDFWYRTSVEVPEDWKWWRLYLNFDAVNWKADVWFNGHLLPNTDETREHSIEGAFIRGKFNVTEYTEYGGVNYIAVRVYRNDSDFGHTSQEFLTVSGQDTGIYGGVWLACRGTIELLDPYIEPDLGITQKSVTTITEDLTKRPGVTATCGADVALISGGGQWTGADLDGDNFTVDFGTEVTVGCVTMFWGTLSGGAEAGTDTCHPESFRLERSVDGAVWVNIDAHESYETDGKRIEESQGTYAFAGHTGSDIVQGASLKPVRYIRFTSLKRRVVNGLPIATRVSEIRVYKESPEQVEKGMVRTFKLDDTMSFLKLKAHIRNNDTIMRNVEVTGIIKPNNVRFRFYSNLEPGETRYIERAGIPIKKPRLWWPNGYGEQFLYTCDVSVKVRDNISDIKKINFGIRKFTHTNDGGQLTLYCNGTRIVCKGEGWENCMTRGAPLSYDDKVRLRKEANLTMIRNVAGLTNSDAFYDACDKYGILVWDDFWRVNQDGELPPSDIASFLANAEDKIKRNRYHTSLALYCGGSGEENLPPEVDEGLKRLIAEFDENRVYISYPTPVAPNGENNVKAYFNEAETVAIRSGRDVPAVTETDITTSADFIKTAQMINYENARGLFDSLAVSRSNGLLMRSSRGTTDQLRDWYFGVKAGSQPTRAVFDPRNNSVVLANASPENYENIRTTVEIYNMDGAQASTREYVTEKLIADAYGVVAAYADFKEAQTDIVFLRLILKDSTGAVLGENTYLHNHVSYQNYGALSELPKAKVIVSGAWTETLDNGSLRQTLHVINESGVPAVHVCLRLAGDAQPVFFSDNYITLMPGEIRTLTVESKKQPGTAEWLLSGLNI